MNDSNKNFLETMQSLDESMKRRVLAVATFLAMVVVIYVWVGYLNSIVAGNPSQLALQDQAAQGQSAQTALPTTDQTQPTTAGPQAAAATVPPSSASASTNALSVWALLGSGLTSFYRSAVSGFKGLGTSLQAPRQYNVTPQQ